MPDEYTVEEKNLMARFMLERSMHTWDAKQKIAYIAMLNRRAGLPFGCISLLRTEHKDKKSGEVKITEVPYASRQTTVELGKLNKINVHIMERDINDSFFLFVARATDVDTGRSVDATGVCVATNQYGPLTGDFLANKIMHAETKAKRRATLEICGLAFLDESETESMENATKVELPAPDSATTSAEAAKGNGAAPKSDTAPKATSPSAPKTTPTPTQTDTPKTTPSPKPAASPTVPPAAVIAEAPPAPVSIGEPIPARYAGNELFAGDDSINVGDKAHIDFIVAQGKGECGWDGPTLSKWLFDTFGVRASNAKETLSLGIFKRIMTGIDEALTSAGR